MLNQLCVMLRSCALVVALVAFGQNAMAVDAPAPTAPCQLTQLASLDMTRQSTGRLTVPVTVGGTSYNFLVTLDGFSAVTDAVATKLALRREDAAGWNPRFYNVMGLPAGQLVTVPDVLIGSAHMTNVDMFVAGSNELNMKTASFPEGDAVGGVLGTSILAKFDVEFDFKANKLKLFMPGHCGPSSVYWAHDYAVVPFEYDPTGNVILHMQLDGKDVTAKVDFNAPHARMGTVAAEQVLGVTKESPGFTQVTQATENATETYRYPFKTLSMGGLAINNPEVTLYADKPNQQCQGKTYGFHTCWGGADIVIGMSELRALHMIFSFTGKKLYVTSADEHL